MTTMTIPFMTYFGDIQYMEEDAFLCPVVFEDDKWEDPSVVNVVIKNGSVSGQFTDNVNKYKSYSVIKTNELLLDSAKLYHGELLQNVKAMSEILHAKSEDIIEIDAKETRFFKKVRVSLKNKPSKIFTFFKSKVKEEVSLRYDTSVFPLADSFNQISLCNKFLNSQ